MVKVLRIFPLKVATRFVRTAVILRESCPELNFHPRLSVLVFFEVAIRVRKGFG